MSKTALLTAIRRLEVPDAIRILDARPDLFQARDREGRNLLHLACTPSPDVRGVSPAAQVRLVRYLFQHDFEIDEPQGKDACTALFFAVARARNPSLVRFLIESGAKPARAPGGGLFAAAWWDDVRTLRLLIGAGAVIDQVVGVTPFLAAWCWRRIRAAKCLALAGADVNARDPRGRTALHHGIEKEFDPTLLRWLVRHGASPDLADREGVTARQRASRKRDRRYATAMAS